MSTDPRPVVSVCVANYNGEHLLAECLRSVLAQENAPAFEIIVHDDASTDRSLEVLSRYPSVRVLAFAENAGFCVSNNRMADAAAGEFLLLLNNDAQLLPDALAVLLLESQKRSHRAVLGLPQLRPDGRLVERGSRLDPFANPIPITGEDEGPPATVLGACLWIPAACWRELGGFPAYFFMNVEDVYLCCRARMWGMDVRVARSSGYLHAGGATFGAGTERAVGGRWVSTVGRRYLSERNKMLVMGVFLPVPLLLVLLPLHLACLLIEAFAVAAQNRNAALLRDIYLRAVIDAFALRSEVAADRRAIAESATAGAWELLKRCRITPRKLALLLEGGLPELRQYTA
jgi:GT2 family glycosyltransferase